ncbi:MAG: TraR/DksA family transcriptional regulator [Methyloprofundus sp.]|nr:TraR/DksA family transcriptional regulator [Methyloprofundus sp.]MBW6453244.1 TraR/DksA family transcriptional regulator [Methyloprofundus sp.]
MDKTLVEKFENQLQGLLTELEELEFTSKAATATVVLDQSSVGRLSRIDAMQGQQMAIATECRRKEQISQIKAALKRIQENDFGYCLSCEEEIPAGRLAINPATTLCVKCAK